MHAVAAARHLHCQVPVSVMHAVLLWMLLSSVLKKIGVSNSLLLQERLQKQVDVQKRSSSSRTGNVHQIDQSLSATGVAASC